MSKTKAKIGESVSKRKEGGLEMLMKLGMKKPVLKTRKSISGKAAATRREGRNSSKEENLQ